MSKFYCSIAAQMGKENLAGTAASFQRYILLEYPYPFKEKAIKESSLSTSLKTYLETYLTNNYGKLLLIRQEEKKEKNFHVFFYDSLNSCLNKQTFPNYEALHATDLDHCFAKNTAHQVTESQYFICTNGTRDQCCAKFGYPIYKQFQAIKPQQTWQCSHIGGHRFAPTGLFLPMGIYYGHMQVEHIAQMIQTDAQKALSLNHYRGRTAYKKPEQAAEYFLRQQLKENKNEAIQRLSTTALAVNKWAVYFEKVSTQQKYVVHIAQVPSNYEGYLKCTATTLERPPQFQLLKWEEL